MDDNSNNGMPPLPKPPKDGNVSRIHVKQPTDPPEDGVVRLNVSEGPIKKTGLAGALTGALVAKQQQVVVQEGSKPEESPLEQPDDADVDFDAWGFPDYSKEDIRANL